jgi:hypothetical protein
MKRFPRRFTFAKTLLVALSALVLLPPVDAVAQPSTTQSHPGLVASAPRAQGRVHPAANSGINLIFQGGTVLDNNTSLYAIFWEPTNSVAADYNVLVQQFLGDVGSSPQYQIAHEYGDLSQISPTGSRFAGAWVDNGAYPENPLLDNDVRTEVARAKQVNGWSSDVNNIFLVFTQRDENLCFDSSQSACAGTSFCSYHGFSTTGNTVYAVFPYAGAGLPCSPGSSPNNSDADSTINQASSEIFGTTTDASPPRVSWADNSGLGIGGKCNFQFGPRDAQGGDEVLNGHDYIVQELWDNYTVSCRMVPSTTILPGTWPYAALVRRSCLRLAPMISLRIGSWRLGRSRATQVNSVIRTSAPTRRVTRSPCRRRAMCGRSVRVRTARVFIMVAT